jgi:TolB-like protein/Flp pilus assembly protein TadD
VSAAILRLRAQICTTGPPLTGSTLAIAGATPAPAARLGHHGALLESRPISRPENLMAAKAPESNPTSHPQFDRDRVEAQLARILASAEFAQAARLSRFLRYVVGETLAGRGSRLNQYAIGVDVFERDPSFDPTADAIVRVEAARLRSKLRDYYDDAGRGDAIRIALPKGHYAVRFEDGAAIAASRPAGGARAGDARPAIVVLPFANMGAEPDQAYFADGITEDLITDLSKLSAIRVIARQSAFAYRDRAGDLPRIRRELGVRYVLSGSVRRAGNRVRISVQLVDAESGVDLWAKRFDEDFDDIFRVQDEVARRIVAALAVELSATERKRLGHKGTASVAAYDLLLRGQERFWLYGAEDMRAARALFQQGLAVDPNYAAAHAWIARTYLAEWAFNWSTVPEETLRPGCDHAARAVALDDLLPAGHTMLCWAKIWLKQPAAAIAEAERAIELDPNDADARLWYALSLTIIGRFADARAAFEIVSSLNPHPSALLLYATGLLDFAEGHYEDAAATFERTVQRSPNFIPAWTGLAACYGLLGQDAEAADVCRRYAELRPNNHPTIGSVFFDDDLQARFLEGCQRAGFV